MSRNWLATFATEVHQLERPELVLAPTEENPWAILGERLLREQLFHPNLRTNDGIDWTSGIMGGGPVSSSAQLSGTATGTSATTLTNTGAAFPTSGGYGNSASSPLAGKIVVALTTGVYGVILSNTATVLTIDRWNSPATPGGSAATTPSATTGYVIMPGGVPTWWMALSSTAISPGATDHTLSGELSTNGFARVVGGWTHTNGTNTFTLNNLFTCTGGTTTINGEAIFNAQNGGIMTFESVEPTPPSMIVNDTMSQSVVVTY